MERQRTGCHVYHASLQTRASILLANFIKKRPMKQMRHSAKILGHLLRQFRTVLGGLSSLGAEVVTFGFESSTTDYFSRSRQSNGLLVCAHRH